MGEGCHRGSGLHEGRELSPEELRAFAEPFSPGTSCPAPAYRAGTAAQPRRQGAQVRAEGPVAGVAATAPDRCLRPSHQSGSSSPTLAWAAAILAMGTGRGCRRRSPGQLVAERIERGSPPCSPQMPYLMPGLRARLSFTAISISRPTARWSDTNGSFSTGFSPVAGMELAGVVAGKPVGHLGESLVPKLMNSTGSSRRSAPRAAAGFRPWCRSCRGMDTGPALEHLAGMPLR